MKKLKKRQRGDQVNCYKYLPFHLIQALCFLIVSLTLLPASQAVPPEYTRVSVDSSGNQANAGSSKPSLSSDGRYVAFESWASNLVSGDTNGTTDIFVHDRQTGRTTRVSVDSSGSQANGNSYDPSISGDGRYVAFSSYANNLVSDDTNGYDSDIFVHDRQTGRTTRISVDSSGSQVYGNSSYPALSGDGRYVAFLSVASNLVSGDTNGVADIFVHDRQTGQTSRVSVDSSGNQGYGGYFSAISGDGRYVVFDSRAGNLVVGDTNGINDIFVHDRQTGQTSRVSVDFNGNWGYAGGDPPAISGDGRYVAFDSNAKLVSDDTNSNTDVIVRGPLLALPGELPGDINGTNSVDLSDAILALQAVTGIEIVSDQYVDADVNGDGMIGLAEAVYALRFIADSPPQTEFPDIEGSYASGPVTVHSSNCLDPGDNGPFTFSSGTLIIFNQSGTNFSGTITLQAFVEGFSLVSTEQLTGTVSSSGELTGTFEDTLTMENQFVSSGNGKFTGQVSGNTVIIHSAGKDTVGDICTYTADATFQ